MKTTGGISSGVALGWGIARLAKVGTILLLGLLAGCAGNSSPGGPEAVAGASFGPGYPPGSAAWRGEEQVAYRTGFMAGLQDQREGYRFDDDRGAMVLDESERGFYRQGYRRGYYHDQALRRQERQAGMNPVGAVPP